MSALGIKNSTPACVEMRGVFQDGDSKGDGIQAGTSSGKNLVTRLNRLHERTPDLQFHGRRKFFFADGASTGMDGDGDRSAGFGERDYAAWSAR